ncbi:MAG: septal ring lytic transglycosylase RlpA family protein [Balneolaceae bacterium]|nr:septal ring lytic transglycosylase RlpA family protein [Balneolaceae bacterium]
MEEGVASWYGPNFHGKLTANGETYNMYEFTAAHRTLPFNTVLRVENRDNGESVVVRINDRGPFAKNRIIDLSKKAAEEIDMISQRHRTGCSWFCWRATWKIPGPPISRWPPIRFSSVPSKSEEWGTCNLSEKDRRLSAMEEIPLNNNTLYRVYYGIYKNKDEAERTRRAEKGI